MRGDGQGKLRILFLTQFFSSGGGGEVVFHQWAHELSRRGHKIYVICQERRIECAECLDLGIQLIGVPPYLERTGGLPPTLRHNLGYLMTSMVAGKRLLHSSKVDVVHSNTFAPVIVGLTICLATNIPHIATVHDVYTSGEFWRKWSAQFRISPLSSILGPFIERIILRAPIRLFHTVSERSRKDMLELGASRPIVVIPNCIDESKLVEFDKTQAANTSQPTILSIGRLVFYKNLEVVIDALKIVIKEVPAARLVVLGEGPMRKIWAKHAHDLGLDDAVSFKGFVSDDEKMRWLRESALFVFPSTFEGFGFVILEALACARPVIVSNVDPLTDLVRDGFNGYLASPKDPLDWSKRIAYLLLHPLKAAELGENGRIMVKSDYSIKPSVDRLEELYHRVLE